MATLREAELVPPLTRAWLNFITLTFIALGRNHKEGTPIIRLSLCFVLIKQSDSSGSISSRLIVYCWLFEKLRLTLVICALISFTKVTKYEPSHPSRCYTIGDSPSQQWHRLMRSTNAQPTLFQEPTLLPKVRIQFADFPYLHLILFDQRLITLETWCGFWYGYYFGVTLFHVKRQYGF